MPDRNKFLERLTPDNCAMLLIDHQTGTMLGVQDFRLDGFRRSVLSLASAAELHNLPTVLTGSYVEGPNGPILDDLLKMFPDAPKIYRPGPISAWHDPNFVKAVTALGRKKLIMAGVNPVNECHRCVSRRSFGESLSTSKRASHAVWSTTFICSSFIRPPCTLILETAMSISRRSAGVS
jgi:hypothetical protein